MASRAARLNPGPLGVFRRSSTVGVWSWRMDLHKFTRERILGRPFQQDDPTTEYWSRDGVVYYRAFSIAGADPSTFRFYLGSFAKDANHCYCTNTQLRNAHPESFRAMNFAYFTDDESVWTMGGRLPDVDATTFVVCDDGANPMRTGWVPYGYGKDSTRVYYYDFSGKPCVVRKAAATTFESLGDHYFGRDHQYVFCGLAVLPGANRESWRKIHGHYSTDGRRIYYFNRRIAKADAETFQVYPAHDPTTQLAKDRNTYYWNDGIITQVDYDRMVMEDDARRKRHA